MTEQSDSTSIVAIVDRVGRIVEGLERDRHEPDKVLCYVADLKRLRTDLIWGYRI